MTPRSQSQPEGSGAVQLYAIPLNFYLSQIKIWCCSELSPHSLSSAHSSNIPNWVCLNDTAEVNSKIRVNAWHKAISLLEIQTLPYFCHPEHTDCISQQERFMLAWWKQRVTLSQSHSTAEVQRYLAALETTLYIVTCDKATQWLTQCNLTSSDISVSLTILPFHQEVEKPSAKICTGLLVLSVENADSGVYQVR